MRIAVINTQNGLLSGAIIKYMQERGEMKTVRVFGDSAEEPLKTCKSILSDVLLMEVTRISPCTFEQRIETISQMRKALPDCKIALICDENADGELAERVKEVCKDGLIDLFFYSSVSGEYLAAMLDVL